MFRSAERNNWGLLLGWSFYLEGHPLLAALIVGLLAILLLRDMNEEDRRKAGSRAFFFLCLVAFVAYLSGSALSFGWLAVLALDHAALQVHVEKHAVQKDARTWLILTFVFCACAFLIPDDLLLPEKIAAVEVITFLFLPGAFLYTIDALQKEGRSYQRSLHRK
ncbi:MAG: hypothetical protein IKE21_05320 [Erysipelotrichaceae bacterium]|nr:hypothetical protein [Erysipelotrichaceae bacterium]